MGSRPGVLAVLFHPRGTTGCGVRSRRQRLVGAKRCSHHPSKNTCPSRPGTDPAAPSGGSGQREGACLITRSADREYRLPPTVLEEAWVDRDGKNGTDPRDHPRVLPNDQRRPDTRGGAATLASWRSLDSNQGPTDY